MKKIDIHVHAIPSDPMMDRYVSIMDRHAVAAALVHGVPQEARDNPDVLRAVKAHPGRLFGSVHVDLREPLGKCVETVRRYAGEGFRSIKLFPNLGFDPNDERFEPFWQVVDDLGLLCFSHCGWLGNRGWCARRRVSSLTATPFHFEIPARRFPEIRFIFAHFGGGASYLETVTLISRLPNAFADTCPGWGRWVFEQRMPGLSGLDFRHVLFGTDNAGEGYSEYETWWRETLSAMGRTEEDLRFYFYANAAGLLGIEE